MNELSSQARQLIALARRGDDPSVADQRRVDLALAKRLGATGVAAGVTAAKAAAAGATSAAGLGKIAIISAIGISAALVLGQSRPTQIGVRSELAQPAPLQASQRTSANQTRSSPTDGSGVSAANGAITESDKRPGDLPSHALASLPATASQNRDISTGAPQKRTSVGSFGALPDSELQPNPSIDPLLAETAALREAQRAMRSGDPARAIALINQQDRQYPTGLLKQERAAARIFAHCALGQVAQAQRQARVFEQHWPRSPMLARVQTSCGAP